MINRELKLFLASIGVALGVYLIFEYVLGLVTPFLIGLLVALVLKRPVYFLRRKLRIPYFIGTLGVLIVVFATFFLWIYYVGGRFYDELKKFLANYNVYLTVFLGKIDKICCVVDEEFGLSTGKTFAVVEKNVSGLTATFTQEFLPAIMVKSINVIGVIFVIGAGVLLAVTTVFWIIKELDAVNLKINESIYGTWYRVIFGRLTEFGKAYLKTQLIVMFITSCVCSFALYLVGNSYPVMIGVIIGLLDALPLFGTGAVLIPWTLFYLFTKRFYLGAVIFTAYCVCYLVREVLEPKLMGGKMGIHPLVMLMSIYVGMLLWGVAGVVLGPVAYIIVTEIIKYLNSIV